MHILRSVLVCGLAALPQFAVAVPESVAAVPEGVPGRDMQTLVAELADESFGVREQASRDLWQMGEDALPELEEALRSGDPEQAFRARELVRRIHLFITPETDPSVIDLVERYMKASPSHKIGLLGRMQGKRAWRQMLKLFALEKEPEFRVKVMPLMSGVALRAARERLVLGDDPGAREFLEMAPANQRGLLALADFHRCHGTLEAELERATEVEGRKSAAWQLALHRVKGDLEGARKAALEAGEPGIAAAMAALSGDPLPWIEFDRARCAGDPVATSYLSLAGRRWHGEQLEAGDFAPLVKLAGKRDLSAGENAMTALLLLGEVPLAEQAFTKLDPVGAFSYFGVLERDPEALEALGLDADDPDYGAWVKERVRMLIEEDIEEQHEVSIHTDVLEMMAAFLERRGLHEQAMEAFSEPMLEIADKDVNVFVNLLSLFFNGRNGTGGAPVLARQLGMNWAGEDGGLWNEVLVAALGDRDLTSHWWEWLKQMDPDAGRGERFDAMLALFRVGDDAFRLREKWLARAWQEVGRADEDDGLELVEWISSLSIRTGDVENSLKALALLSEKQRKRISWGQQIVELSAAGRWDDAAEMTLETIALAGEGTREPRAVFHAYAASALRQAGRGEEAAAHDLWVEKLVLGDPKVALEIAAGYAYGLDYDRASDWWFRAVRSTDPGSTDFLAPLKRHSDALLEAGEWDEAASTAEVLAMLYSSSALRLANPLFFTRQRMQADLARALSGLDDDRAAALGRLRECHRMGATDGALADSFFPALRMAGLAEQNEAWFLESWNAMQEVIRRYPKCDDARNTAAWFASRAALKLDEAEELMKVALDSLPYQSAYLDTMAEINFARGRREKALEWSRRAVNFAPGDPLLRQQQARFLGAPIPNE